MHRRTFIAGFAGGLFATTPVVHAQRPVMPVIGFVRSTPSTPFAHLVTAFRQGLNETGFVEEQDVRIEVPLG